MDYSKLTKVEVLKYIKNYKIDMTNFPQNWNDDDELVLELVKNNNNRDSDLYYVSERLQNDKSFIIKLISINIFEFEKISKNFKDDKEIALIAIKKNYSKFHYISERLKKNKEFILEAVKVSGNIYLSLSPDLRKDKEVVYEAVKGNPLVLYHTPEEFQNSKELLVLLDLLEEKDIKILKSNNSDWYQEKMELLTNIRDKEFLEKTIISNNKLSKKIKF